MPQVGQKFNGSVFMSQSYNLKRLMCVWVAVLHLIVSTVLVVAPAHAQSSADNTPPVVDLQLVETGIAGDSQVFSATVTDNTEVAEVLLYYRVAGAGDYDRLPMTAIPGTTIYTVTVDIDSPDATAIEYYINAADANSNRVVRGFSFDPLVRVLEKPNQITAAPEAPAAQPSAAPSEPGMSTGRKILIGALGLLAVGALAAASSGGSSSSGGGGNPGTGPTIPVTITVAPVATEFD